MIRWIVRVFCLGVFLFGLLLAVIYPMAVRDRAGREIGTWRTYEPGTGFGRFEVSREQLDIPVDIHVEMTVNGPFEPRNDRSVISLVAWGDGSMIIAAPLYFMPVPSQAGDAPDGVYRDFAGAIDPVDAERYLFVAMPGEAEDVDIAAVDVVLEGAAAEPDQGTVVVGYVVTVLGLGGLALSFRRRRAKPSAPRWGRG